jgi:protein-glutamine gamma-glutamyltransferase
MVPELSRLVRRATFCLVALGAGATEIAAVEARPVWTSLLITAAWVGVALVIAFFARPPATGKKFPPRSVLLFLLLFVAAPFVLEPVRRAATGEGYPLELQMLFGLRNLGLGLAAFAVWPLCLQSACIVSLFLMLFGLCMTTHSAVLWLLGLYCAVGSTWLMLVNWSGLRNSFATTGSVTVTIQTGLGRLPWFASLLVVSVVGCMLTVIALGPQRTLRSLGEWLPTSGGADGYDPFARGGLNDGDEEIRGNSPKSTGMVETDQFLDSPLPTLYDLANDMYGEPFKPKEQERTIALDSRNLKIHESQKPPADNKRPSREFATARRGPKEARSPGDRSARAIFEIQGRTPLHIRAVAFDAFDGTNWREAPLNASNCRIEKELASCWMRVEETRPEPIFTEVEAHQIKIAEGVGSLIPTPPYPIRFRVGRVDRASFFGWGQEHILRFAERKTPSGITIETESHVVDPRRLHKIVFFQPQLQGAAERPFLPSNLHSGLLPLVKSWTQEKPRGWSQIDAVVDHLRTEYELDPSAHTPDAQVDPLADFLLVARRGPDYQFASAAAVLLRLLEYPTRLVSGFYAAPVNYDVETRHTPVVKEDLHFWAEVRLPSGVWVVIEPTPGYEILGPSLPWWERISASLLGLGQWLWHHAIAVTLCLVGLAALWWKRLELLDRCSAMLLRIFPGGSWDRRVGRALWLLECRGRWAGRRRAHSQTPALWLACVLPLDAGPEDELRQLMRMADWSSYAAGLTPPWLVPEMEQVCRRVLDHWTLARWRRVVTEGALRGESL